MPSHISRRTLFGTGGAAVAALAAGCLGSGFGGEPTDDDPDDESDPDLRINGRFLSSAFPIEFVDPDFEGGTGFAGDARIAYVHWHGAEISHWHQSPLELTPDETRTGRTRFLLEGADAIPLGPDEEFSQSVEPVRASEALLETAVDGGRVQITAVAAGEAELEFELRSDGERRWTAPPLPVEIE